MYGGAERHDKSGDVAVDAHGNGALEGNGDCRGRRLGAEGGEIGGHHRPQGLEGVVAGEDGRDAVLEHEQDDVEDEDDDDDAGEGREYRPDMSGRGHRHEDAEDIDRQKRDYDLVYDEGDDAAEVVEAALEGGGRQTGCAKAEDEGEDEGCHDVHKRLDLDVEEGRERLGRCLGGDEAVGAYERGKCGRGREV